MKSLLNKNQRENQMKHIFALYLQDENNLKDYDGRMKTYMSVVADMKYLVSVNIIKKMLQELKPEMFEAMKTLRKHHNKQSNRRR